MKISNDHQSVFSFFTVLVLVEAALLCKRYTKCGTELQFYCIIVQAYCLLTVCFSLAKVYNSIGLATLRQRLTGL